MKLNSKTLFVGLLVIVGIALGATAVLLQLPRLSVAGVDVGSEYIATTTKNMALNHNLVVSNSQLTLGSIVVASSSTTTLNIWDATSTTDVSSSTVLTLVGTDIAEGVFPLDITLNRGLVVEIPIGFSGEYLITFRR